MKRNKNTIINLVIAVVLGVGGFFGGMQYQKSKAPTLPGFGGNLTSAQRAQFGARAGRPGTPGGGGFISGQIISKDDKSVTIKDQTGSTKIVYYSDSTKVSKQADGALGDLNKDSNVTVSGKANSDGSIAADTISIRPAQN
jgi:hypothetical protein